MNLQEMANELEDPNSNLSLQWDQEYDRHVMQLCLEKIAKEVSTQTMQAFQLHALEELPAKTVADKLGMTPVAVYGAKARVMAHLRNMAGDLLG